MNLAHHVRQLHLTTARLVAVVTLFSVTQPSASHPDGFRNPFQSGAASAQGNAFAAQADDASAVFYNPAAMTQLQGVQLLGGVEFVNVDTHFENPAGETTENDLGGPFGMLRQCSFLLQQRRKTLYFMARRSNRRLRSTKSFWLCLEVSE